jgi:hypothetical protein
MNIVSLRNVERKTPVRRNKVLILALLLLMFLFVVGGFHFPSFSSGVQDAAYNLGRVLVFIFAGWTFCSSEACRFSTIVWLAVGLSVFDHVILKGGLFLLEAIIDESVGFPDATAAFSGVLISFLLYAPIAVALVFIGSKLMKLSSHK